MKILPLNLKGDDLSYDDRIELNYDQSEQGVLVTEVEPGGWASVGGLHEDDLIQAINGQKVVGIGDVERILTAEQKNSASTLLYLLSAGFTRIF